MKSLNEELKTGHFKQIYLLYGEEAYLKKLYKNRFVKAMVPEGDTMNEAEIRKYAELMRELDLTGLDTPVEDVAEALAVNAEEWRNELPLIEEWFEFVGEKLPTGIKDENGMQSSYMPDAFVSAIKEMNEGDVEVVESTKYMIVLHRLPVKDDEDTLLESSDNQIGRAHV